MPPEAEQDTHIRALRVLETLAGMQQPAPLPTIAERVQLSKTTAYRILRGLQDHGFIDHTGRTGYRIGSRAVALASLIGPRPALLQIIRPVLKKLATEASETVTLHLRSGAHRVLVLAAEPPGNPLRILPTLGERSPLTSGCSGQSILAFLPRQEADDIVRDHTRDGLRPGLPAALARIRKDSYALSFSGIHIGFNGVAAPLLDPTDGTALGSIAIAGLDRRLPRDTLLQLSTPLRAACADLAPRLATVLGPNSSIRLDPLDVMIRDFLDQPS
ncbi:IclR family transcriptional regulator [Amycolatopsis rhizosphaerae]|uniref:IclR family transcriptional regulator n=1 Tax=Amycolatopsis rhizosphaerae TaxID=2053003 RepID=A0A558DE96_9PSEU|nr:IclR family transcriptional regulator [Amycolatopsis rhizosphaerae]TVT59338.1 IclR family transcriptional regulator [Amycolatopsis rhizosphaerae]